MSFFDDKESGATSSRTPPPQRSSVEEALLLADRLHKYRWKKFGAAVVFLGCLAGLVVDRAAHLGFGSAAVLALIVGCVLGALDLL